MDLSRRWLNEFVPNEIEDRRYAEAMTLSGSKVEGWRNEREGIDKVVVGKVLEMARHENSDHLWVCQIDVGSQAVQIVTGAQNVSVGDLVPVALHGSTLPNDVQILAGELRGVTSNGMMCSLKELGLTTHDFPYAIEDGIFILQEDCRPGDDICSAIGLNDSIVEFEITPNRPDCLSMIGLARETAATFRLPLQLHNPEVKGGGGDIYEHLDVEIENGALCPRYTARMVKNVKVGPSPRWLRERLRAAGVRPISNIVDITNYVMLEYGQPMHAFDFACVGGGRIVVRTAREGEQIVTLDGKAHGLSKEMLVIADEQKPVGVAGVMGGENSEIVGNTEMVVFESANFNGISIRKTAFGLGMRTDASARYEKGLDPMITLEAVNRACELVELLGCGEVLDGVIDVIAADKFPTVLDLRADKINALLGTDIPAAEMAQYLTSLGFLVENERVTVPSWRADVETYADLAEEVARLYGYDRLPMTLMRGETTMGGLTDEQAAQRRINSICRSMGYSEILTYSFTSPENFDKIALPQDDPRRDAITILNPLGEDTSIMRTTALPAMLEVLGRNEKARNSDVKLYELATVYYKDGSDLGAQSNMILLGGYGAQMDFFSIKGEVEALLAQMNVKGVGVRAVQDNQSYHPGRCAALYVGETCLGTVGQVHPLVAERFGLGSASYVAELCMQTLLAVRAPEGSYQPLPKFPAVMRDIAVVCAQSVTVGELTEVIAQTGSLLADVQLFDIYTGTGVPEGKKSVAFSLKLQSPERTLTDGEADAETKAILQALEAQCGAVLR